jgi:hypothetical protein
MGQSGRKSAQCLQPRQGGDFPHGIEENGLETLKTAFFGKSQESLRPGGSSGRWTGPIDASS